MAYVSSHTTTAAAHSRGLGEVFGNLVARYQRWRKVRQTYIELNALSDYQLKDLGLTRSSIRRMALEAVGEH